MMIPTIHMNGTSKEGLLDPLKDAYRALNAAVHALTKTAPHGRDYYVQGPTVITAAMAEHAARIKRVQEIADEIERIAIAIQDQGRQGDGSS